jgi:hypothetical protein
MSIVFDDEISAFPFRCSYHTHPSLSLSVFIYVNKAGEIVDLFTFSLSLSLGEIRK